MIDLDKGDGGWTWDTNMDMDMGRHYHGQKAWGESMKQKRACKGPYSHSLFFHAMRMILLRESGQLDRLCSQPRTRKALGQLEVGSWKLEVGSRNVEVGVLFPLSLPFSSSAPLTLHLACTTADRSVSMQSRILSTVQRVPPKA